MSAIITNKIEDAAKSIAKGGVVLCPSEGVYGLSCSLFDENAIKRIISIKQRDIKKGLIVVAHSLEALDGIVDLDKISKHSFELIKKYWPGPHTFVLPCLKDFQSIALKDNHSLAVRITDFKPLASLSELAKCPLISTSANISGFDAVSDYKLLDKNLVSKADVALSLECGGQCAPTSIYDTLNELLVRKGPNWKEND